MKTDLDAKFGSPGDTIVAAATPPGKGATAMVRISGPAALETVAGIFATPGKSSFPPPDRVMTLGIISDPQDGRYIDQALLAVFRSPNSYTGEDVAEIHCHGGPVVVREIVSLLLQRGARAALPGEFTLRALANRRMDLTQAESVLDVIEAKNRRFLDASVKRLSGALGDPICKLRGKLVDLLASIEVAIDYPEDDTPQVPVDELEKILTEIARELRRLLQQAESARITNEGFRIAVIGLPNSGKSSLINRLLGRNRVIVSDIPGTTRDLVGDWTSAGGLDFFIMDTAGITDSPDPIEEEGVRRTLEYVENVDLAIALFDGSSPWTSEHERVVSAARKAGEAIPVISKIDLPEALDAGKIALFWPDAAPVKTSAITGQGISSLLEKLVAAASEPLSDNQDVVLLNIRHRDLIAKAVKHLDESLENTGKVPDDILSIDIRAAIDALGEITGESATEDILNSIFANFCVGK